MKKTNGWENFKKWFLGAFTVSLLIVILIESLIIGNVIKVDKGDKLNNNHNDNTQLVLEF